MKWRHFYVFRQGSAVRRPKLYRMQCALLRFSGGCDLMTLGWGLCPLRFKLCGLLHGLHHGLLHAIFTRPIQADLVPIRVVEIGVPPAPRHHARQLGDIEAFFLELAAELVQITDLEVKAYAVAGYRDVRPRLMQGDGAIATRGAQTRIHRLALMAKVFD